MFYPSQIELELTPPHLDRCNLSNDQFSLKGKSSYHKQLKTWQRSMFVLQQTYYHQHRRAIIVFQGWDASGKGGAIRRLTETLDPRGVKVHSIAAPTELEQGRHYLYRFQQRLPSPGIISIFDRSWYERVLVERVEGFASDYEWQRAYQEINEFERMLIDDGVRIVKVFMHIDQTEQLKRFRERFENPLKHWKLTVEDLRNRDRWSDYERATNDMFRFTSTTHAPWQLIPANKKWYARVSVLKAVCDALAKDVDLTPPTMDKKLVNSMTQLLREER
ncbi:polyphosphate kinase 2 family protein [Marinomonas mediterranea]|jgi:Uncharacterized conserved protein|uniref:Polyphosphate kinase-2-related protein n=1 Tax=Marinomonas mediterranea (strain ATCC 700492 / JCM 21426 / NBRC 103028 / MMB-1) TaxID=717774 RepID=F2JXP3_MARM1|nr:PPK2 family polyphosphate kinase [Marinomonas mediterranea]ADZ93041.1 Polyphosphate kinase-2-related protein [Marinomonas mediterranea MMB-1]WCN10950.1 polyphosphate kinase [Marinomonas mediterranea]WCN15012.1 polyphosphate kinase [Marinomonas mediterranea]WCN19056.1 polyphosphate kinase [Marinomonas mediterranea MMB-1]